MAALLDAMQLLEGIQCLGGLRAEVAGDRHRLALQREVSLQESKRDLFDAVIARTQDLAAPLSADDIRGLLDAS